MMTPKNAAMMPLIGHATQKDISVRLMHKAVVYEPIAKNAA